MKPLKSMTRTLGYRSVPALFASILLGVTAAQAGPTLTYGEEGFVTLDYSIQAWGQNR